MRVYLSLDDVDRHDMPCDCGLCDMNGKSFGVGIYKWTKPHEETEPDDVSDDLLERIYACSEEAAFHNAELEAKGYGWRVVHDY